ncbi:MAG TPA: hypothetical protein VJB69_02940 [Candidatus Paceibacterota bacterium]
MILFTFFSRYFAWHYTNGLVGCIRLLADFLWFIYHFFSIPVLGRTLFTPWRRLGESYRRGFDPEGVLETIIVNVLMRLFGLVMRIVFLVVGFVALFLTSSLGIFLTIIFFFAPLVIAVSFIIGFYLLFLT